MGPVDGMAMHDPRKMTMFIYVTRSYKIKQVVFYFHHYFRAWSVIVENGGAPIVSPP